MREKSIGSCARRPLGCFVFSCSFNTGDKLERCDVISLHVSTEPPTATPFLMLSPHVYGSQVILCSFRSLKTDLLEQSFHDEDRDRFKNIWFVTTCVRHYILCLMSVCVLSFATVGLTSSCRPTSHGFFQPSDWPTWLLGYFATSCNFLFLNFPSGDIFSALPFQLLCFKLLCWRFSKHCCLTAQALKSRCQKNWTDGNVDTNIWLALSYYIELNEQQRVMQWVLRSQAECFYILHVSTTNYMML